MIARLAALLAVAGLSAPLAAQDPDCRTIRAMTNADGRRFADLRIGIDRPFSLFVRAGARGEGLPTPENCDLNAGPDEVGLTCYWRPGDYAAANSFYDALFTRLQTCLGGGLTSPAGPSPYGDSIALRRTTTEIPAGGGISEIDLALIEASQSVPAYHYITLSVAHRSADD